jgi:hypothetical protein
MPTDIETWVSVANLVLECIFFIIVGVITAKTYARAKRTIFQPIRTEIFKTQLQELSSVLRLFVGQGEVELRRRFGFHKLLSVNIVLLYDCYARLFFDMEFERDERPYNSRDCPISIVSEEFLKKDDLHIVPKKDASEPEKPDPRVRAALWQDHKHGEIAIPREHSEMQDELKRILESPILPKGCAELLEDFQRTVEQNTFLVGQILTECAAEMPEKYPTVEALQRASFSWIRNKYNEAFEHLKPKADEVVQFVRGYWLIDQLLES